MTERNIMAYIAKLIKVIGIGLIFSICVSYSIATSASALSQDETKAITSNCSTIKQSLGQLQKIDSRTRTYLGTTYEAIANRFITPLNLRLVRNSLPTFSEIQSSFSMEQAKFRDSYTNYMREMETLITIDCQTEPERFYDQLVVVRERRKKVKLAVEELKKLTEKQYQSVTKLRKELQS